jgi:isoleucyl-tRNA synthetase
MYDFKTVESEVKEIWKKNKKEIEKSIQYDSKKKLFSFLEGPPTANAPPGLHHLEARTYKDLICRFRFMQGFSVPRKGGWDCHGLPVEVQVEKKLKLDSKKDIEKYGVKKFINQCKKDVFSNISEWNISTEELGYWIDLKNPYVTLENNYIESVWWSLKELYNKKMLYEDYKVVPFCPRCGTPLSSHEVSLGYKDITEESVYIAFKLKGKSNEYILAWTTTPWTLPGNVALAVGEDIDYVKVKLEDGNSLILGRERLNVLKEDYKIIEELKGKNLVGIGYEPLYKIKQAENENSHKIILADFVTTEDGTGVVHTAGMYGEDDYEVCKKENLPLVHTVNQNGTFNELVPKWQGRFVKDVEDEIKEDLKQRSLLYKTEKTTHSYPFCWRCDSPLLYYAVNSWFVKVSSIRDKLVKINKEINWEPKHIRDGRFGKWLEGAKDWSLSRFKFWGTPLPIWKCECGKEKVIGSIRELKENSIQKITGEIDLHKSTIDNIKLKCECGKQMKRIPDVIDCWYDSGSAPFAQFHYPFENKKEFEKRFPYDYVSEAIDQTRGWFYTMHVLATILFNKSAYKNVICAGHIVDEKGEKMSKSKGNIINPKDIIDRTGVDAIRLQFCTADAGNSKRFSYDMMKESVIPFLTILYNANRYYMQLENKKSKEKLEDKWILSRLNSVIKKITENLENYRIDISFNEIQNFVINDFSRSYIKITRNREDISRIIEKILKNISLLLAPFAPYISEKIFSQFSKDSVHLSKWPKVDEKKIDKKLEENFDIVFEIIEKGLAKRNSVEIGLRWPLKKAIISGNLKLDKELQEIIKSQLNIKKIEFQKKDRDILVELDISKDSELEAEGYAREISRNIQAFRKKLGLQQKEKVKTKIITDENFKKILEKNIKFIVKRTNLKKLEIVTTEKERFKNNVDFKIKDKRGRIIIFN